MIPPGVRFWGSRVLRVAPEGLAEPVRERLLWLSHVVGRRARVRRLRAKMGLKIYYGCGWTRQPGYVNVDVRWTGAVDLIADLAWCSRNLRGMCHEVYLSHVLEHYGSPGKEMRVTNGSVLGALMCIREMLVPGGVVRIAVPDFAAVVRLYVDGKQPLYPRILGRLVGEQTYPENRHLCAFDRTFAEACLTRCGFVAVEEWDPTALDLARDASFDEIDGVRTSLNLKAVKPA